MSKFRTGLLFGSLIASANPLAAQADHSSVLWRTILQTADGTILEIDSTAIVRTADSTFIVATGVRFPPSATAGDSLVEREVDVEELDCGGGRSRGILAKVFTGNDRGTVQPLPHVWAPVPPGRLTVFNAACEYLLGSFAMRLPREYDVDAVEEMPEIVNRSAVAASLSREYPALLRDIGQSGEVLTRFRVTPEGRVDHGTIEIISSTHPEFAEAARRVLLTMRFRPAKVARRPVAAWVTLPVQFQLAGPFPLPGDGAPGSPPGC